MTAENFPFCNDELLRSGLVAWGTTLESKPTPITLIKNAEWINANQNGELNYLVGERFDLRQDIKNYFPEFKEAIVFLFSYKNTKKWVESQKSDVKIASYALGFNGQDYHVALGNILEKVKTEIYKTHPNVLFKTAIDMHPVLDRDLAFKSGLGWFGKNSMLINRNEGSYFMIASLFVSEIIINKPNSLLLETDHCGSCTRCVDACPTDAIDGDNRTINANLCISTHTIEYFSKKATEGYDLKIRNEVFGCDICQDVCPYNIKLLGKTSGIVMHEMSTAFKKIVDFFYERSRTQIIEKLTQMSNKEYKAFFFGTSFFRSGKRGILKNFFK